jgi:ABC-type sugar transport system permease subunit
MRWTGKIRFLLLLPAVIWVLAFTVFPLGYSLYLAFFKIESKVEVVREKVVEACPCGGGDRRPERVGGDVTIYGGGARSSHLLLPIIPA